MRRGAGHVTAVAADILGLVVAIKERIPVGIRIEIFFLAPDIGKVTVHSLSGVSGRPIATANPTISTF